jgi:putative flavoprotein involved in K+ transport
MADYLEGYATRFELPVHLGTRVTHVQRGSDGFRIDTAAGEVWRAGVVVLATGGHQAPQVPELAAQIAPSIRQLHSSAYREPSQLADGDVLVVGAGNSGAEIAIEAAMAGHRTCLAGRSTGHIPARAYVFNGRIMMFLARHLLTRDTPLGRRMAPLVLSRGGPLIRLTPDDIVRAGVTRVGRVTGVEDGLPVIEGEGPLAVGTIVWATGYQPDFGWVEPPIVDAEGHIRQERGVALDVPDLYFVGQPFQTGFTSALIDGAGRDAARVGREIAERLATGVAATG